MKQTVSLSQQKGVIMQTYFLKIHIEDEVEDALIKIKVPDPPSQLHVIDVEDIFNTIRKEYNTDDYDNVDDMVDEILDKLVEQVGGRWNDMCYSSVTIEYD